MIICTIYINHNSNNLESHRWSIDNKVHNECQTNEPHVALNGKGPRLDPQIESPHHQQEQSTAPKMCQIFFSAPHQLYFSHTTTLCVRFGPEINQPLYSCCIAWQKD